MTHSRRASGPPTKMKPTARWLMAALFGAALVISAAVAWAMHSMPAKDHSHDTWVQSSTSPSAVTDPADPGKLRSLLTQVEHADDQLQKAAATANADPDSDTSVIQLDDAQEHCSGLQEQYNTITDGDPAAAAMAELPRRLSADTATDCAPDHPDAVASLPTVSLSGIPAAD